MNRYSNEYEIERSTSRLDKESSTCGPVVYYNGKPYVYDGESHVLYIGKSGKGKSRCGTISTVLSVQQAGESYIVSDPKGEIYNATYCFLKDKYIVHSVSRRETIAEEELYVEPTLILEEVKSKHKFIIPKEGGVFGRYGQFDPHFFQDERFSRVSRRHIVISYDSDSNKWSVKPNSETNDTYIDGRTFKPSMNSIAVEIRDGQMIGLADIYFKVIING